MSFTIPVGMTLEEMLRVTQPAAAVDTTPAEEATSEPEPPQQKRRGKAES